MKLRIPPAPKRPRITLNGHYLDEVQIREAPWSPSAVSLLSFPACCHEAHIVSDELIISTNALTILQLYVTGVLSADMGTPVSIRVGEGSLGDFRLDRIEVAHHGGPDRLLLLRMRRLPEAPGRKAELTNGSESEMRRSRTHQPR